MNEQDIENFCDITNASTEEARNFLQIADNSVETAVLLYMESKESGIGGESGDSVTASSRPSSVHSGTNENILSDEALARQIQEKEDEVRAPIVAKTDILAGGDPSSMYHSPSLWSRRDPVATSRPSVFNQGDSATGSVTDFLSRINAEVPSRSSTGSPSTDILGSPASAKTKRLADLFRPPFDIMYRGNFEEARETAKENDKWLMINVQDATEFACQVMNRDLWSDSFVKDIIRESFIFLQYGSNSADGKRYSTFYTVNGYPHLAIIDARTGERVKVWEKQITPTDFMMDITEFLEQHSSENARSASTMKRPRTSKNVSDMSEEEQLNAAIAASLSGGTTNSSKSSPEATSSHMEIEEEPIGLSTKGKEKAQDIIDSKEEEIAAGSAFDGIKAVKRDETTDMTNSTRIQLRMGDGSRIIRRFLKTDTVRHLFEFVKAEVPNAENQPFELVFNRTQLIDLLNQTIAEAGLSNAAVNCVFV